MVALNMSKSSTNSKRTALIGGALLLLVGWHLLDYPTSLHEAYFLRKLASKVASGAQELKLAELMPGEWELVCASHGYDGPLFLDRYNKTFTPAAPWQDGFWGLIFISSDGSYTSAAGSCATSGAFLSPRLPDPPCMERDEAVLVRGTRRHAACPEFVAKPDQ